MTNTKLYAGGVLAGLLVAGAVVWFATRTETINVDASDFPTWHEVTSEDGLFTAALPSSPTETRADIPVDDSGAPLVQKTYTALDDAGSAFIITTVVYPEPFNVDEAREVLGAAVDGMAVAVVGNELTYDDYGTHLGYPAVDFIIENGTANIQGKVFFSGRVLYQAMVAYEDGTLSDAAFAYFVSAFTPNAE